MLVKRSWRWHNLLDFPKLTAIIQIVRGKGKIAAALVVMAGLLWAAPFQSDEFFLPGAPIPAGAGGNSTVIDWGGLSAESNPALMTQIPGRTAALYGANMWSSLVDLARGGVVIPANDFSLGAGVFLLSGDGIKITSLTDPDQPISPQNYPQVVDEKGHYTLALTLAGAKKFGKLSLGAAAKLVRKKLTSVSAYGFSLSAGMLWQPAEPLNVGIFARDISTYQLFWDDGVRETGMPSLSAGISYSLPRMGKWRVQLAPEISWGPDDGVGFLRLGAVVSYANTFAISVGTQDGSFTSGAQIKFGAFSLGASGGYHLSLGGSYAVALGYEF